MLAQNFKSADELQITEPQREALIKTLVLFETGKLVHVETKDRKIDYCDDGVIPETFSGKFSMNVWCLHYKDCGTVACIGGTAELIGGVDMDDGGEFGSPLDRLFYPDLPDKEWHAITPTQAATALRSYLTTGDANWQQAVGN